MKICGGWGVYLGRGGKSLGGWTWLEVGGGDGSKAEVKLVSRRSSRLVCICARAVAEPEAVPSVVAP